MITIGYDPEVFWKERKSNKLISVIGKLGGSKKDPRKINDRVFVLEDNVAAEFNGPPAENADEFVKSISENIKFLAREAKKHGFELAENIASGEFEVDQLQDPAAFVFGCEPDFNAWTGEINPPPFSYNPFLRSCGGHVHVGGIEGVDKISLVRAMDLYLGVPSALLDKDIGRSYLYGRAGCWRDKPYGIEYRTMSNWWVWENKWIEFVFDRRR